MSFPSTSAAEPAPLPFWVKLAAGLSTVVTVGFLTWAGVVYQGWQDVRELLFETSERLAKVEGHIRSNSDKLTRLQFEIDRLSVRIDVLMDYARVARPFLGGSDQPDAARPPARK